MAAITSTYVKSLNGMTGGAYPRNLNTNIVIDAGQIKRSPSNNTTIRDSVQNISQTMKILVFDPLSNPEDCVMKVDTPISYNPVF